VVAQNSIFLKNGLKIFYKIHLRSDNYEACTAVARCFPNILDAMVLENVGRLALWSNETDSDFYHQSPKYAVSSVYFNHV
jgi:hypothetical protein